MPDPHPYPDLPLEICGEIYQAVSREIRAITLLAPSPSTVFGNRIYDCESIQIALDDKTATTEVPALLIAPGPNVEIRIGNAGYSELTTAVDLGLLTKVASAFDTQAWLRMRIFHQVKLRLMLEQGTLRSGDGTLPAIGQPDNRITNALKGYGRIDPTGRLVRASNVFLTTFRVTFVSDIDEATRTFIG